MISRLCGGERITLILLIKKSVNNRTTKHGNRKKNTETDLIRNIFRRGNDGVETGFGVKLCRLNEGLGQRERELQLPYVIVHVRSSHEENLLRIYHE